MRTLLVTLMLLLIPAASAAAADLGVAPGCDVPDALGCAHLACTEADAEGGRVCVVLLDVVPAVPYTLRFSSDDVRDIELGIPLVGVPCGFGGTDEVKVEADACDATPGDAETAASVCTFASVSVEMDGRGWVAGSAQCGNDPYASCSVSSNGGSGYCYDSDTGRGASWWRCAVRWSGSAAWRVVCTFR